MHNVVKSRQSEQGGFFQILSEEQILGILFDNQVLITKNLHKNNYVI